MNEPFEFFPFASKPRLAFEDTRMSESATLEPPGAFVLDQSIESGEPSCVEEPLFGFETFSVALVVLHGTIL